MESVKKKKPHAVCVPLPAQGHINPMLKLAKLIHCRGFHITFVHTEFNYQRLVKSDSLKGTVDDFKFETISDGLPSTNQRGILDLPALCVAMPKAGLSSFRDLILKLSASSDVPPVSCIVSDGVMSFTLDVAKEFGIPATIFFTPSACGMLGYLQFEELLERGYFPLKDEGCFNNGYLDTQIDWIPGIEGIQLKHLPTFFRSTNIHDTMFNYNLESVKNSLKGQGIILNTFDELEQQVLGAVKTKFPHLYTVGPLSMLQRHLSLKPNIESNLWKEDMGCLDWLDKRTSRSVVYVNFGSLIIMTPEQLSEFSWGLAHSNHPFLWVIRPDLVKGGTEVISKNYMDEIKDRGLLVDWCPQEKVLHHPSIGGFLTHCGWNSTLESISEGIPMICWPFFADQQINCFYSCCKWGVGMEIDTDAKRYRVQELVHELMVRERGKVMKEKAMEWRRRALAATTHGGSSYINFDRLLDHLKS